MLSIELPIENLPNISKYFLSRFKNLGLKTIGDLLHHFPVRYEDFTEIYLIANLIPNQEATIQGIIKKVSSRRAWRRRGMTITEAVIEDETGRIKAIWFNQPYIQNQLKIGKFGNFSGKIKETENGFRVSQPAFEPINSLGQETKHTARLVPIYPETRGLTSKGIRHFMKLALDNMDKTEEFLPSFVLQKHKFPNIEKATRDIHFPDTLDDAFSAKRRFAFEDLFLLQIYNLEQKIKLAAEKAYGVKSEIEELKNIISSLPFELTPSQKQSLWEITKDIGKNRPMNRLLQGDVGSGKTVIAAIAAIETAKNELQTAFMAPTEILARQHYHTITKLFPEFEKGVALLTSSEARISYGQNLETETKKPAVIKDIADNRIKIIIGTHALIQKNIDFPMIALVIVDEQHRFGVHQRAELIKKNQEQDTKYKIQNTKYVPHFLSMSATPIPRTLSLTLWGDLDISLITELPKNRKVIITKIVDPANRNKAYQFIREQIQKGRQAFVICPRIEPPSTSNEAPPISLEEALGGAKRLVAEGVFAPRGSGRAPLERANRGSERDVGGAKNWDETKTVKEEWEKLSKKVFPDLQVSMLHGKMPAKGGSASGGKPSKEEIMRDFKNNKINILVSTSVIEVGVDVPNATIMMIEGSERFGLAQLYQFRGRVGRGEHQSFCLLFTDSSSKSTSYRLKSIVEAKNGLELAEKDLKLRGPGEFLGEVQTGMPDIAMKALQNPDLVKSARDTAAELLKEDRRLKNYPLLKTRLQKFQAQIHWE